MEKQQKKREPNVLLNIKTLDGESNKIFNYQEGKYVQLNDDINGNYYYFRKYNDMIDKKKSHIFFKYDDGDILFRLRKSLKFEKKYEIINPIFRPMKKNEINLNQLNKALWYVIKNETNPDKNTKENEENEDYILNENDLIKCGNKIYEIVNININNNNINNENNLEYNISQINHKKGSIFNINLEHCQYCVNNNNSFDEYIQDKSNEKMNNPKYNILKKIDKSEIKGKSINHGMENDNKKKEICNKDSNDDDSKNDNKNQLNKNNDSMMKDVKVLNSVLDTKNSNNYSNGVDDINSLVLSNENERCRICLKFKSTEQNPKLRICSCKNYVHFECLKEYIKEKMEILENPDKTVKTYKCPDFNCHECFTPYPTRFRIKEYKKIYELIDYKISSENYLVLESLDYIIDGNNFKLIHVIQLTKEKISLGRKSTNDIIDLDTSVSRYHAVLKYNKEKGYITIENRSEKFGTLVLIKGNIIIKEKKIGLQVGHSYITAKMSENNKTDTYIPTDDNESISLISSTINSSKTMNH